MRTQTYSDASNWFALLHYNLLERDHLADAKFDAFARIRSHLEHHLGPVAGKTLVEVGCGQWEANVRLFAAYGSTVIGIDPELRPSSWLGYPGFACQLGVKRAIKSIARDAFFRARFDRRLQELSGRPFNRANEVTFRISADSIPLPSNSVDAVFSDNVFEHIEHVDAVTAEMARVLKPGGICYLIIHPFAAFSGGHNLYTYRRHDAVPPWDHLRQNLRPSGVYLNRWRETDYQRAFEAHLSTLDWERLGPEGEEYLTSDILSELPDFSRDELLTGKLCYTGCKR